LTLFHLVDAIDAGAIIDRRVVPVERGDTFAELYARVAVAVRPMLTRMAAYVAEHGQLPAGTAQDETLASVYATPPRLQRAIYKTWWALRR
jgi:methionyl-tRNA formyltransferase